jgi:hypothetical protein
VDLSLENAEVQGVARQKSVMLRYARHKSVMLRWSAARASVVPPWYPDQTIPWTGFSPPQGSAESPKNN